jgi:hypothetical protein
MDGMRHVRRMDRDRHGGKAKPQVSITTTRRKNPRYLVQDPDGCSGWIAEADFVEANFTTQAITGNLNGRGEKEEAGNGGGRKVQEFKIQETCVQEMCVLSVCLVCVFSVCLVCA